MKLKHCKTCRKLFVADPWQRRCGDCLEAARLAEIEAKKPTPFVNYQTIPDTLITCEICGTVNRLTSLRRCRYCRDCESLIFDPKLDLAISANLHQI